MGNLVFALNTEGKNRPIFWFFQSESEFISLAKALGPNQPLYGMRSLVGIVPMESYEDNYQQIGELVYREIQNLLGQGPYLFGGNCQAAVLALDVARRTTEDKTPPHTLILME